MMSDGKNIFIEDQIFSLVPRLMFKVWQYGTLNGVELKAIILWNVTVM